VQLKLGNFFRDRAKRITPQKKQSDIKANKIGLQGKRAEMGGSTAQLTTSVTLGRTPVTRERLEVVKASECIDENCTGEEGGRSMVE